MSLRGERIRGAVSAWRRNRAPWMDTRVASLLFRYALVQHGAGVAVEMPGPLTLSSGAARRQRSVANRPATTTSTRWPSATHADRLRPSTVKPHFSATRAEAVLPSAHA